MYKIEKIVQIEKRKVLKLCKVNQLSLGLLIK